MSVADPARDAFYDELYEASTAPFVSPVVTAAETQAFVQLAGVDSRSRVLDIGCGWGRHLAALRSNGMNAIGLERAAGMAAKAAVHGPVVRGDVRALPFVDETFDAAACFYSSIFFFEEDENLAALREVARVLKPGGAFVLQTGNPLRLRKLGREENTLKLPDGGTVYERTDFDKETGRDRGYRKLTRADGTTIEGSYWMRHYAPGELEAMGHKVGLRLERVCGDLTLSAFARNSQELIVLMRKRTVA